MLQTNIKEDTALTQVNNDAYAEAGRYEKFTKNDITITIDHKRDDNLTYFGKATLKDRYLLNGETFQTMFGRVACAFADDQGHAQRLYDYISNLWFMPATPVLSNGGTTRGLPISCFLNEATDDLDGIQGMLGENFWLAARGGGIGSSWSNVRSIGEKVGENGQTSGIIPFIRIQDSQTLGISQGSLRRGSSAAYLDVSHPEIEEFLGIRKPSGDFNRKSLNIHQGLTISDAFMTAVHNDTTWDLVSPHSGEVVKTLSARSLWAKILETRIETGEPYIVYSDTVNNNMPAFQRELGLSVKTSNLCSEIMLHTGEDHLGKMRTAVCCLSSVNLEKFTEWQDEDLFIEDIMRFLDNVLQNFIDQASQMVSKRTGLPTHGNAIYSAIRERAVGLGVMGFHTFLQANNIPMEGVMAKSWNLRMFKHIRAGADAASQKLAEERGPCPDAAERGVMERFSHKMAVAPTASISIIAGETSPCIEPIMANFYTHKTLTGSHGVRNVHLEKWLDENGMNTDEMWEDIISHQGSCQHIEAIPEEIRAVFKTAYEMDQRWLLELQADRSPYVCQGVSLNLYLDPQIDKWDLHMIHFRAWQLRIKSLYYCRSFAKNRVGVEADNKREHKQIQLPEATDYEECLACT